MCPCRHASDAEWAHPLQRFVHLVMRRMVHEMNDLLRELHLSMPQMGTLHFLRAEDGQSVSAIAEHLHLSLAATSHLVDRLVQRELVTRVEDASDRRLKRVELAPAGFALVERVHGGAAAAFEEVLEPLPPDMRERLGRSVLEVLEVLVPGDGAPG